MKHARPALQPALPGMRYELYSDLIGALSWYQDGPAGAPATEVPLLLLHSINAAASAYEVLPLYEYYRHLRPVYALEFPGFGFSERSARPYTPRLMTDAIHALTAEIRREHPGIAVDAIALSLSCEFLARAANEQPDSVRSLALFSPTGFNKALLREGRVGSTLGSERLLRALHFRHLGRTVFRLLTRRRVIRHFLRRTWGARKIDEQLLEYDYLTAQQDGAELAPLYFIAGYLFAGDSGTLYRGLTQPVWALHGTHGDFVQYRALCEMAFRTNWSVESLPTGALPHFERLDEVTKLYERWRMEYVLAPPRRFGLHDDARNGMLRTV